jgi:gamma-glutamyl phosphate reductase
MAAGLEQIAALADPIGEISNMKFRPPASRWARCACRSA